MSKLLIYITENVNKWKYLENIKIANYADASFIENDGREKIKLQKKYPEEIKNIFAYEFAITTSHISIFVNYNPVLLAKNYPENLIFIYNFLRVILDEFVENAYTQSNYKLSVAVTDLEKNINNIDLMNSWFHYNKNIDEYQLFSTFVRFYKDYKNENMQNLMYKIAQKIMTVKYNKKINIIPPLPMYSPIIEKNETKTCCYCMQQENIFVCHQCTSNCNSVILSCVDCWQMYQNNYCVFCNNDFNLLQCHICVVTNFSILPYSVNTSKMQACITHNIKIVSNNKDVQKYLLHFDKMLAYKKNNKIAYTYEDITAQC